MIPARVSGSLALVLLALAPGCRRADAPQQAPLPVTVAEVREARIPVYLEHVGTTEAVNTVAVRARVAGVLEQVLFKEGADVEQNALLFVIEQKPYQTRVAQSKAQLERVQAAALRTQADFERTAALEKKDVASKSDLDHARAARDEAVAEVDAARAALEQAQLDLGYTEIRAPISGRVGKLSKDQGNLVGSGEQTVLTTIVQLDPIYIYWSPSERTRLDVLRLRKEGVYAATAVHAVAGFLGRHKVETSHLVDAGGKLPVIITFVDTDEHVNRVLPTLKEMAAHRLIVRENVVIEQGSLD
jgi:RND family efflux transporter MFP subunit